MVAHTFENVLEVTTSQVIVMRKDFNLTQEIIDKDIDSLIDWYNRQQHLPKHDIDRGWVERVLLSNKWSMERAKERIDFTLSSRTLLPKLFTNLDPDFLTNYTLEATQYIPLPKLHNNRSRVVIVRAVENSVEKFDLILTLKYSFMLGQYRMVHDYFQSETYIYDMKNITTGFLLKSYPATIKQLTMATRKVFGIRVLTFHIINSSPSFGRFISVVSKFVNPKLLTRFIIHENVEDIFKYLDRSIIPKDYGGQERCCDELNEQWNNLLCRKDLKIWFQEQELMKSDENKRSEKRPIDNIFGVEGSFRSLMLD